MAMKVSGPVQEIDALPPESTCFTWNLCRLPKLGATLLFLMRTAPRRRRLDRDPTRLARAPFG
jgi:hypothetical protein